MKSTILPKPVLSPFLGVIFAGLAVTGLLMFFHIKNGMIVETHEWLGLIFVVAGILHTILHFRQIVSYLKLRKGLVSFIAGVLVVLVMLLANMNESGGHHHGHGDEGPQYEQH